MFTTVGYGIQEILPRFQSDDVRYVATSKLVNLRSALTGGFNLHTSNNPGKGNGSGGACFGDSGGPVFYGDGESNVIAGIVSFGLNYNCKGADFAYRADIANTQDWVSTFLIP
jgi:secreted trypsin-like serine protease